MSVKTKKEAAITAHGDVEYEVVECANCDTELLPEEAVQVTIGEVAGRQYWSHKRQTEVSVKGKPTYRALCEYCAESNLDYGGSTGFRAVVKNTDPMVGSVFFWFLLMLTLAFGPVLLSIGRSLASGL